MVSEPAVVRCRAKATAAGAREGAAWEGEWARAAEADRQEAVAVLATTREPRVVPEAEELVPAVRESVVAPARVA